MSGPGVRILLPPAKSLQIISSSAAGPITARRCGPREAIRQRVDFVGAHRVLTAAGMAGDTEVGAAALQELRRAQPNISLAWITNEMPIMQGGELEHYLEAFRRAGLD